jgi:glycerate-2-kinase
MINHDIFSQINPLDKCAKRATIVGLGKNAMALYCGLLECWALQEEEAQHVLFC